MEVLRRETCNLELRLRPYHGHGLASIPPHELDVLERQLEHSVLKVRERKVNAIYVHINIYSLKTLLITLLFDLGC